MSADDHGRLPPRSGSSESGPAEEAPPGWDELGRALFESLECVCLHDFEGRFLDANPAALELLGFEKEQFKALDLSSVLDQDQADQALRAIAELRETGGQTPPTEYRVKRKTGGYVEVGTRSSLVTRDGRPYAVLWIGHDITEQKRAQAVMAARLRLLEFAGSHSLDGLLRATLDEAEALTGSQVGFYHFIEPDQLTLSLRAWSTNTVENMCTADGSRLHYSVEEAGVWVDCVRERRPVIHNDYASLPHRKGLPDGHAPVFRELVVPVLRRDSIVAVLGVGNKSTDFDDRDIRTVATLADLAWDIAESKRIEETLSENRALFEAIVGGTTDAVYAKDLRGRYLLFNEAAENFVGKRAVEVLGKDDSALFPPDEASFLREVDREVVEKGRVTTLEETVTGATGRPSTFLATKGPIRDENGKVVGSFGIARDITERREAEKTLRLALFSVDNSADLTMWLDRDGRFLNVSESLCVRLGYPREELLRMSIFDVDVVVDPHAWPERWHELKERGPLTFDREYRTKSGELIPMEVRAAIFEHEGQEYDCGIARDISERKRAETAMRESEDRYRNLVDLSPDAMVVNVEGRYAYANAAAARLFGARSAVDVVGLEMIDRIHPDFRQVIAERAAHVLAGKPAGLLEIKMLRLDGSPVEVETLASRIEFDGRPAAQVILRDITERKQAERALGESERMLTTLMANLPGMAYRCLNDRKWTDLFLSEGCEELTGYTSQDLVGNARLSYADLIHPDDRELVWQETQAGVSDKEPFRILYRIITADGETKWVWEQGRGVFGEDGSLLYLEGFATDISERVRAEEALREAEEQLRQSQKMEAVGQLAGGIAHDFNNLLTAIVGYGDLLLADPALIDSPARGDLEEIRKAAERATALTRQILAFSRRQALQPALVSLNTVLDGMEPLLRRTLGEDIDLVALLHPELGEVEVDVHQFEQVIINLALNARHAMPSGGRLIMETANVDLDAEYCRTHADVEPGGYIMLSVSDTGMGMDDEVRSHIFEPFFTTKAPGEGTGLGLATVYGIVKQSGGTIDVYSEPGRGTSFKVYLPRVTGPVQAGYEATSVNASLASGRETVLVVEDESALRSLVARVLGGSGYSVLTAASADEALQILAIDADSVDLLLTDVVLPGGMQGDELVRSVRDSHPDLPVLYMSGYTRNAIIQAGRLAEGVNYLEKPFTPDTLAGKVREVLDQASRS